MDEALSELSAGHEVKSAVDAVRRSWSRCGGCRQTRGGPRAWRWWWASCPLGTCPGPTRGWSCRTNQTRSCLHQTVCGHTHTHTCTHTGLTVRNGGRRRKGTHLQAIDFFFMAMEGDNVGLAVEPPVFDLCSLFEALHPTFARVPGPPVPGQRERHTARARGSTKKANQQRRTKQQVGGGRKIDEKAVETYLHLQEESQCRW